MILLVCGGRDYHNFWKVDEVLSKHLSPGHDLAIIEGGATGADSLAREWAGDNHIPCATIPAPWEYYGRSAGYIRNQWMLRFRPDLVYAFPGGKGTASMIKLAKEAGVEVIEIE